MPSAFSASRDYMVRAISGIRSGLNRYEENLDKPGLDIKVEPFDATNVSTPAALIKLGTTIAAAKRARANRAVAEQDLELERDKTRAEIARLRAEAAYDLGQGRQTGTSGGMNAYQKESIDLQNRRENRLAAADQDRRAHQGKLANAKAALAEIEKRSARESEAMTTVEMAKHQAGYGQQLNSPNEKVRSAALVRLGINPEQFKRRQVDKTALVRQALTALRARIDERNKRNVNQFYAGDRNRLLQTIDEEGNYLSTQPAPEDTGVPAAGADPLESYYSPQ